jgi:hypothetical protein
VFDGPDIEADPFLCGVTSSPWANKEWQNSPEVDMQHINLITLQDHYHHEILTLCNKIG